MKKNKIIIFILVAIIIVLGLVILFRDNDVNIKEYSNDNITVQQNMSDSDIEHKAINKLTDEVLKSKEKSKLELERKENRTPDEQAELNSLNRQIEKINIRMGV